MNEKACIIIGNTVTAICSNTGVAATPCDLLPANADVKITPVSAHRDNFGSLSMNFILLIRYLRFLKKDSLQTTNIIMASWSRAMWQSVVNRAIRMLASGPFGSHFFSAVATVGGN
ncbi:hypothetical protein KIN20_010223 [Parelaphostrongylus tenuis]|uniref:Uncharacterized protein n=1 Tax=Parelaphostrongylus tenuis TaxID=148309 RepID=A0AAD5M9A8_PARTN|nr:hypothetical protein KIN20_010223 [Parelaphostrongylus tenuis]